MISITARGVLIAAFFAFWFLGHSIIFVRVAVGQATDEIHVSQLGERGVTFESPLDSEYAVNGGGFKDGQGIGDFDGDGLDDIALSTFEGLNRIGIGNYSIVVVYGRQILTGRHRLAIDGTFPRVFVLRGLDREGATIYDVELVNPAGDMNGDGLSDLLFGNYQTGPRGTASQGVVYLVYGGTQLEGEAYVEDLGINIPGTTFFSSNPEHGAIGFFASNVGDVNGDGRDDLAIGAPQSSPQGRTNAGIVFVLLDTRSLGVLVDLTQVGESLPGFQVHGTNFLAGTYRGYLGQGVTAAGDVDNDGFGDIFITASGLYPKRVYLLRGDAVLPPVIDLGDPDSARRISVFLSSLNTPRMAMPRQALGVGDVNGDGFGDILVGASKVASSFGGPAVASVVYLFYGRSDFPALVDFTNVPAGLGTAIHGTQDFITADYFGSVIAPAGDLNSDGIPDFLIGASRVGGTGEAYAVLAKRDWGSDIQLMDAFEGLRIVGEDEEDRLGEIIAPAGDFNGDGVLDVLVVVKNIAHGELPGPAFAYLIYGTPQGESPLTVLGVQPLWGPVRGGTGIAIRGSGFRDTPGVFFGDRPSPSVTLVSPTELKAVAPPGRAPGPVDVSVIVGGETRVRPGAYEYTPDFPELDLQELQGQGFVLDGGGDLGLGASMAFVDLNGDGAEELVARASRGGDLQAVVVHGGRGLPATLPAFAPHARLTSITSLERDGVALGTPGDVNGDGIEDLGIVVHPSLELGAGPAGYIVFGRRALPAQIVIEAEASSGGAVRLERGGPVVMRFFAAAIAGAGDITGDGIDDFAVSFPEAPGDPLSGRGEILFLAGRRVWPEVLALGADGAVLARLHGERPEGLLAGEVVRLGDVNGDGLDDFLANSEVLSHEELEAYLLYGSRQLPRESDVKAYIEAGGGAVLRFLLRNSIGHYAITAPGDANGDGHADLLVGVSGAGPGNQGNSFLVPGGPDLPSLIEIRRADGGPEGTVRILGEDVDVAAGMVGPAGDFDGDGLDDFVIASSTSPPVEEVSNPGRLFIVFGRREFPATVDLRRLGGQGIRIDGVVRNYGVSVTADTTGDLDGDGIPDFAFQESDKVYVIFGLPRSTSFVRGEASGDGRIDVTDAVFTLNYLFLEGAAPTCEDAADADDSGRLEITDGVYLLNHLFLDGPAPPPPYPELGLDPRADALRCP